MESFTAISMLPHEDERAICLAMSSRLTTMESMNIIFAVDGRRLSNVNSSTVGSGSFICTFFTCFLLLCAVTGDRQTRDSVAAIAMIIALFIVFFVFWGSVLRPGQRIPVVFLWLWFFCFGFLVRLPFLLEKSSIRKALSTKNLKPKNQKPKKKTHNHLQYYFPHFSGEQPSFL